MDQNHFVKTFIIAVNLYSVFAQNLNSCTYCTNNESTVISQELELEYNPSNWELRVPPSKAVSQHVDIVTKASEEARKLVPHKLNVRYGRRGGQLLDIYGTDLPKGSPIFVYLHGGYWQELNKDISAYPAVPLWKAGIRCVVGGYDLAPNVTLDVIVQEARELAIFVLEMAKEENCNSLWFGGHSAGAHLCASLLEAEWYNLVAQELTRHITGVVLISGIYDLSPLVHTTINDPLHLDTQSALQLSPMFKLERLHLTKEVRAVVIIGEHDSPAFHRQAAAYSQVLMSKNIVTSSKEISGLDIDHFSIVANLQHPSYSLTQYIISLINQAMVG